MIQKHLEGPDIIVPEEISPSFKADKTSILKNVKKLLNASSPIDNLSANLLMQALNSTYRDNLLSSLKAFIDFIAAGKANPEVRHIFVGASLIALVKSVKSNDDGSKLIDTRPIAQGNMLRKLIEQCALDSIILKAKSILAENNQFAMQPGGTEKIIHQVRHDWMSNLMVDDYVGVKIDFVNAFNEANRSIMVQEMVEQFPELAGYIYWSKGSFDNAQKPTIYFGKHKIYSTQGGQQGAPLTVLEFSLLLARFHNHLIISIPELKDLKKWWFVDDGYFAGPANIMLKLVEVIIRDGPEFGLKMNLAKSQIVWPSNSRYLEDSFPTEMSKYDDENFDLLGAPIGNEDHCNKFISSKILKYDRLLNCLSVIEDSHVAYVLLKLCHSFCKVIYYMRTVPSNLIMKSLVEFNNRIRKTTEKMLSISINDDCWDHISLSIFNGGLGIRNPVNHCYTAYLASRKANFPVIENDQFINNIITEVNSKYNLNLKWDDECDNILSQSDLSKQIDNLEKVKVYEKLDDSVKIAFNSYTQMFASSWLHARPIKVNNLYLNDAEFRVAILQRLGIPLFPISSDCPNCDKSLDPFGYHALTCKRSGEKVRRHNSIRDIIHNQARNSQLNPLIEKPHLIIGSKERPADIFIPDASNEDYWIDVAITDPRQPAYFKKSLSNKNAAIDAYAQKKHEKYDHHVLKWNNDQINRKAKFIPVIADSFGAWSKDSIDVFDLILKRAPERNEISYSIRKNFLYSKLSISIQRNNARSILNKQQQIKNFNIYYRNDNYEYNNLNNSPSKIVQNVRENLIRNDKIASNVVRINDFIEI
jgi:hypothetical protein